MGVPKIIFCLSFIHIAVFFKIMRWLLDDSDMYLLSHWAHVCAVWFKDFPCLTPGWLSLESWLAFVYSSVYCYSDKFSQHRIADRKCLLSDLPQMQLTLVRRQCDLPQLGGEERCFQHVISLWKEVERVCALTVFLISVVLFLCT